MPAPRRGSRVPPARPARGRSRRAVPVGPPRRCRWRAARGRRRGRSPTSGSGRDRPRRRRRGPRGCARRAARLPGGCRPQADRPRRRRSRCPRRQRTSTGSGTRHGGRRQGAARSRRSSHAAPSGALAGRSVHPRAARAPPRAGRRARSATACAATPRRARSPAAGRRRERRWRAAREASDRRGGRLRGAPARTRGAGADVARSTSRSTASPSARLLRTGDPRWWVAYGARAGGALWNKQLPVLLAVTVQVAAVGVDTRSGGRTLRPVRA
jgi:hypothetical protein